MIDLAGPLFAMRKAVNVFLSSYESAFISGQILAVDGGWTSF